MGSRGIRYYFLHIRPVTFSVWRVTCVCVCVCVLEAKPSISSNPTRHPLREYLVYVSSSSQHDTGQHHSAATHPPLQASAPSPSRTRADNGVVAGLLPCPDPLCFFACYTENREQRQASRHCKSLRSVGLLHLVRFPPPPPPDPGLRHTCFFSHSFSPPNPPPPEDSNYTNLPSPPLLPSPRPRPPANPSLPSPPVVSRPLPDCSALGYMHVRRAS